MLNTPGIPSVIRKRAQTPPHLRNKGLGATSGGGRERRKSGEKIAKDKEDQQNTLETIFHAGDILEAAKILDLNILRDTALLWIAEEFWLSPLPDNWEEAITVSDPRRLEVSDRLDDRLFRSISIGLHLTSQLHFRMRTTFTM